jgi:hypothetical protein
LIWKGSSILSAKEMFPCVEAAVARRGLPALFRSGVEATARLDESKPMRLTRAKMQRIEKKGLPSFLIIYSFTHPKLL